MARARDSEGADDRNPFAVLGLPPTASPAQVKAAYASGAETNPYLPTTDHIRYVEHYDRHSHAPAPPPNIWRARGLFWIVPVAGVIFMVSGATGPYFLPVFVGSMTVFALIVWLVLRR